MTHTLYYKFILGYLLFGFLGFVTIATVSSNLTYEHLIEQKAEALYDEATMIADNCSKVDVYKRQIHCSTTLGRRQEYTGATNTSGRSERNTAFSPFFIYRLIDTALSPVISAIRTATSWLFPVPLK